MLTLNNKPVDISKFPDGALLMKADPNYMSPYGFELIGWFFENNEELAALIYLVGHLRRNGCTRIGLHMPYIPNARQDRVKNAEDVFTLKYFADVINYLNFESVRVLDPHSSVGEALINNIIVETPEHYISEAMFDCTPDVLFYPDEGAMKRYSGMLKLPCMFGIKYRDWATGKIQGLEIAGDIERIKGSRILIVDDICSRGGTFYHSAKKLKELGAKEIYLYVTHCENTILEGEVLTSGLIEKVYTTNSIFTKEHETIEVFKI